MDLITTYKQEIILFLGIFLAVVGFLGLIISTAFSGYSRVRWCSISALLISTILLSYTLFGTKTSQTQVQDQMEIANGEHQDNSFVQDTILAGTVGGVGAILIGVVLGNKSFKI